MPASHASFWNKLNMQSLLIQNPFCNCNIHCYSAVTANAIVLLPPAVLTPMKHQATFRYLQALFYQVVWIKTFLAMLFNSLHGENCLKMSHTTSCLKCCLKKLQDSCPEFHRLIETQQANDCGDQPRHHDLNNFEPQCNRWLQQWRFTAMEHD